MTISGTIPERGRARRRVAVTGLGLVTPIGVGVFASWEALVAGRSGTGPITRFDAAGFAVRIAAEVKGFRPLDHLSHGEALRTPLFLSYALAAAREALSDSGLSIGPENGPRTGVYMGCGLGGLETLEQGMETLRSRGPGRVSPYFVPLSIGSMAAGFTAMKLGASGPNLSVSTACAAGTHAVGLAAESIRRGECGAALAGGVEAVIAPSCIAGFHALRALSTRNESPESASRPFDRTRDGFVVGEGAGVLVLEDLALALDRGAHVYAELAGFGQSCDAHHFTAPRPDGGGMARAMRAAIADAGLEPTDVDHLNPHGTGTDLNDPCETRAIRAVFGDHADKLAVSATKSMPGHLLGGAGGVEAAFSVLALHRGLAPPTINRFEKDPDCGLDLVPEHARRMDIRAALSNSFGFGGTNACLVFRGFSGA